MRSALLVTAVMILSACAVSDSGGPPATPSPPATCEVSWPGSGLFMPGFVSYGGPHADVECLRQVRDNGWRYVQSYDTAHVLCSGRLPDGDTYAVVAASMTPMAADLCAGRFL